MWTISRFMYFKVQVMVVLLVTLLSFEVFAAETVVKSNENIKLSTKRAPLVIQTQVKGSQEQPNIIYVLPWQNIKTPINVGGNEQSIVLPQFKPINPKQFKQQVALFYHKKKTVKTSTK